MQNNNRKRGAFAQLQDAIEQIKTEVTSQLGDDFGEMIPDLNRYIKTKPVSTNKQSRSSEQKPRARRSRSSEQQDGVTRSQSRSPVQQPRPRPAQQPMRPQQQSSTPAKSNLTQTHRGHSLVSNLNATSARDAIILSEIIGKPLSKRPRTR